MNTLKTAARILLPVLLAGVILWWMYRGIRWDELQTALTSQMDWTWMWLSFPFGIMAQVFRAMRWRQLLAPLGEHPRLSSSTYAIFISYASSLVVPRVGEVMRCSTLRTCDGTNFSRSLGTVVTERIVDVLLVLAFSVLTMITQIPLFLSFCQQTGLSLTDTLKGFTTTGYIVTAGSILLIAATCLALIYRLHTFARLRHVVQNLGEGIGSITQLRDPWLFSFYSIGIWVCYFLHFYVALFCFPSTAGLNIMVALVAFVVGCYAVLVPTPSGAGPWHFAVKTVLVIYGVGQTDAVMVALVIHTVQTLLTAALGLYALAAIQIGKKQTNNNN